MFSESKCAAITRRSERSSLSRSPSAAEIDAGGASSPSRTTWTGGNCFFPANTPTPFTKRNDHQSRESTAPENKTQHRHVETPDPPEPQQTHATHGPT